MVITVMKYGIGLLDGTMDQGMSSIRVHPIEHAEKRYLFGIKTILLLDSRLSQSKRYLDNT